MFKNYLLTSWRNLAKYKGYTAVNLIGLMLGISAFIILGLYVWEDLSFNRFNSNYDRIARVVTIDKARGVSSQRVGVSYPALATALKDNIPEIIETTRIMGQGTNPVKVENEFYDVNGRYATENAFFKIFDFELIEGTHEDVLTQPQTVVLTREFAEKVFGRTSVLGESIEDQQGTLYEIVGVVENVPPSSHFQFDILQALVPSPDQQGFAQFLQSWNSISVQTYVLFDQPRDVEPYADRLREIAMDNGGYEMFFPTLQALKDVHLNSSDVLFEINNRKSDMSNVFIMSAIGLLVLILACFNYVNLVTARSSSRAKEIGIRKVAGGVRGQLIVQHLTESIFQVVLAYLVSIVIVYFSVPFFNDTYSRYAEVSWLVDPTFIISSVTGIFIIGFLSGLYPSLVLSSFTPSAVLKGSFRAGSKGSMLRHSLVVLQFMISVALLAGTLVVYQQMEFIFNADLGYEREQILTLNTGQVSNPNVSVTLFEELSKVPGVISVGAASSQIGSGYGRSGVNPEGISTDENIISSVTNINENYIPTMGIEMAEGRDFSEAFSDSGRSVIVNEAFINMLDWEEGVGKTLTFGATGNNPTTLEIVGVASDFHFATVKHEVEPLIMFYARSLPIVSVKIASESMPSTIAGLEETWDKLITSTPFAYTFLDDSFAQQYNTEQTLARIIRHFSILAISIAAVGLFILSVFTVQQRRKEIGIRKVLGSTTQGISLLLGKDFLKWILISNVIGLPIAWFLLGEWLSNFRYRIDLGFTPFLLALVISMVIAALTISIQSFRAATENPVKSLRSE
ncbi:MAG: ABC transporter permease [Balneolaceae bacterium]|nr:ABC transporter permease [Balneolaceae bacterium]MBO6547320.1 ABC transporter permease [Balneolaceae bacterium]MBO6647733.1 ABC transporter permease [Balneolaceae bacterium]